MHLKSYKLRGRQRDREGRREKQVIFPIDVQTERGQSIRHKGRQADRQTGRQTGRQQDKQIDRQDEWRERLGSHVQVRPSSGSRPSEQMGLTARTLHSTALHAKATHTHTRNCAQMCENTRFPVKTNSHIPSALNWVTSVQAMT